MDGAVRSRGQPQQELGRKVAQQAAIGGHRSMVELVDHQVIEVLGREPFQVERPPERLDRGAQDVHPCVADLPGVEPDPCPGVDPHECLGGLVAIIQDSQPGLPGE